MSTATAQSEQPPLPPSKKAAGNQSAEAAAAPNHGLLRRHVDVDADEQEILKGVREFLESKVAPIMGILDRGRISLRAVARLQGAEHRGISIKGYGAVEEPGADGLHSNGARAHRSLDLDVLGVHAGWRWAAFISADRKSRS